MRFTQPGWLMAGLVACVLLAVLWRRYDARQRTALARFVSAHLRHELTRSISVFRRRTQRGLWLAAVALLCTALAGPQFGFRWEQVNRRGNEIVFAIDTSRSMSTPDVKPTRLARAKLAIDDFANQLDGDAVGIVAFAGSAFLVCPLTLDYGAFHETLSAVDTNTIPRGGTNISSAILEAQAALRRRPGSDHILILVTDGEDLEGSALATAQAAKQQDGLTIFTVGVGTAGGDLIPLPAEQGGGFVKDASGAFVKSRLDESTLKALAAATGGFYVPLGTQGEGLESIYKTVLGPLAKHDLASRQQKIYTERYQWPLTGALGALLASLCIGTRRRAVVRAAAPVAPARTPSLARTIAVALPALLMLAAGHSTHAAAAPASAPSTATAPATGAGDNPTLNYNQGTNAYRSGQFPQAAQSFQQSITKAPSSDPKRLAEQEDAYYNLGNALYRAGQKTAQTAPQDTLKTWNDAVKAYETALQLRADDADSKYNRDLVKRKIAALQQNQNQNQNKNQDKNQSPDKNSGKNQDKNQNPGQNGNQNAPPNQGQPPQPQGQGNTPQTAKNNDPKPGAQPPPGQQPGQAPPAQSPPPQPPAANNGPPQGQDTAGGNPDQKTDEDDRAADNQHLPGQMSREEARELLDSVKGDEHHAPPVPVARRDSVDEPQAPLKNW